VIVFNLWLCNRLVTVLANTPNGSCPISFNMKATNYDQLLESRLPPGGGARLLWALRYQTGYTARCAPMVKALLAVGRGLLNGL
jgi:hypothetical protein